MRVLSRKKVFAATGIALLAFVGVPEADIFTLEDGNSVFSVNTGPLIPANEDPAIPRGAFSWTVDGEEHLFQQWFWFRIGPEADEDDPLNPEQSIDTLTLQFSEAIDSGPRAGDNLLTLIYGDGAQLGEGTFSIEVFYTLVGGTPDSGTSDIGEQISIVNLSDDPLDFHFFQYTDFDLNDLSDDDSVRIVNENTVRQTDSEGPVINETVATGAPDSYELAFFSATRDKLDDGNADDLQNTPGSGRLGPGDVTWAFQWDENISGNGSFLISKNKRFETVPEPGFILLLGSGLAGLGLWRRRRVS